MAQNRIFTRLDINPLLVIKMRSPWKQDQHVKVYFTSNNRAVASSAGDNPHRPVFQRRGVAEPGRRAVLPVSVSQLPVAVGSLTHTHSDGCSPAFAITSSTQQIWTGHAEVNLHQIWTENDFFAPWSGAIRQLRLKFAAVEPNDYRWLWCSFTPVVGSHG